MKMPVLDKNFYPMIKALRDFDEMVKNSGNAVKVTLVAERSGGYNYVYSYDALADGVNDALKTIKVDEFAGVKVNAVRDYSKAKRIDYNSGAVEDMDIPKCNCVYYELEGGSFICVRPSGTEPKLKVYYSLKAKDEETAISKLEEMQSAVGELLEKAKK